jgi:ribosomal protein S18 acetylase RimI-like enzyme
MVQREDSLIYRNGCLADCASVARVNVDTWRTAFGGIVDQKFLDSMSYEKRSEAFKKRFDSQFYLMLVVEDRVKGILGYVDFGSPRNSEWPFKVELYSIYLLQEFQNSGIGSRLFNLGVQKLLEKGIDSLFVRVLEKNPFNGFYEKNGGIKIGSEELKIGEKDFVELVYGWADLKRCN